jgi:hypothetical protein
LKIYRVKWVKFDFNELIGIQAMDGEEVLAKLDGLKQSQHSLNSETSQ